MQETMKRLAGAEAAPTGATLGKDASSLGLVQPRTVPTGLLATRQQGQVCCLQHEMTPQ